MENKLSKCGICFESYNQTNRVPKQLECCNNCFCLKCMQDVYRYCDAKFICPICRKTSTKNPKDFKINKEFLEPKTSCPNCSKYVRDSDFKIVINDMKSRIVCSHCNPSDDVQFLKEFMDNFLEECTYYLNLYSLINKDTLMDCIQLQAKLYVNEMMAKFKANLIKILKEKITKNIIYQFKFDVKNNNLFSPYYELVNLTDKIKEMKNIKKGNFPDVLSTLNYYTENIEVIKKNYNTIKSVIDYVSEENNIPKDIMNLEKRFLEDIKALEEEKDLISNNEYTQNENNRDMNSDHYNLLEFIYPDSENKDNTPSINYRVITVENFSINLHKEQKISHEPTLEEKLFSFSFFDR